MISTIEQLIALGLLVKTPDPTGTRYVPAPDVILRCNPADFAGILNPREHDTIDHVHVTCPSAIRAQIVTAHGMSLWPNVNEEIEIKLFRLEG